MNAESRDAADSILYREESFRIQGAVFSVYRSMGAGFLEAVYQECLGIELVRRGIPHIPQAEIELKYRGQPLQQWYKADFVCYGKIIVEIKAVSDITDLHRAQVMNYLKATGYRLGLLVNFCAYPRATVDRMVL